MKIELSDNEIRVLISALVMSQFYGKDADIAVKLVFKLTSMTRETNKLD